MQTSRSLDMGLLILRVATGGLMLVHGVQKVTGFSAMSEVFPDPLGVGSTTSLLLAIGAEVGCSLLLMAGLITRIALLPLINTMVVAAFLVHAEDPWKVKELAVLYLAIFVGLLATGPGQYSVDAWWRRRASSQTPSVAD